MTSTHQKDERSIPFSIRRILVLSLFLRILGIILTLQIAHVPLSHYLEIHDGRDYIAFAEALDSSTLLGARQWVVVRFPGFPFAVYLLGLLLGKSWGIAGLLLNLGGGVAAVYLFDLVFQNRRATLYFSIFPPSWFLFSSINGTEGFYLFLNLLGLYLIWNRERPCSGYLVLGLTALVRPFAAFVIASLLVMELVKRKGWRVAGFAFLSSAPMLLWLFFCRFYYGSFFHNVEQYAGIWEHRVIDWPFLALVRHSLKNPHLMKLGLVWGTVLFSLFAAWKAAAKWLQNRESITWAVLALWQISSALFYFSLSSSNPFTSIDRYILTALPAQIISVQNLFPRKRIFYFILALLTLLVFLYWNKNHFARLVIQ